jgi:hypothetical protein
VSACWCFLNSNPSERGVSVMAKPVPTTYDKRRAANELDQRSKDLLGALRKPLKPTATLRRRALKNKTAVTSTTVTPSGPSRP